MNPGVQQKMNVNMMMPVTKSALRSLCSRIWARDVLAAETRLLGAEQTWQRPGARLSGRTAEQWGQCSCSLETREEYVMSNYPCSLIFDAPFWWQTALSFDCSVRKTLAITCPK